MSPSTDVAKGMHNTTVVGPSRSESRRIASASKLYRLSIATTEAIRMAGMFSNTGPASPKHVASAKIDSRTCRRTIGKIMCGPFAFGRTPHIFASGVHLVSLRHATETSPPLRGAPPRTSIFFAWRCHGCRGTRRRSLRRRPQLHSGVASHPQPQRPCTAAPAFRTHSLQSIATRRCANTLNLPRSSTSSTLARCAARFLQLMLLP